jgi:tRNA modification GTPase
MKVFSTSAITGEGIDALREAILEEISGHSVRGEQETGFLTNIRHQRLVEESLSSIEVACQAVKRNIPHEMIMLDLYGALRPLDAITGETTTDDILNLIFSSFCIGK